MRRSLPAAHPFTDAERCAGSNVGGWVCDVAPAASAARDRYADRSSQSVSAPGDS